MKYKLAFAPTAEPTFSRLPRWARERFNDGFDLLESEPRSEGSALDIHQLYGYRNVWTWRVPPYRAVYAIDGDQVVIIIFGHRDAIYPDLHRLLPPLRRVVTSSTLARRK